MKQICDAQGIVGDRFEEIQLMAFKQGDDPNPELIAKLERSLERRFPTADLQNELRRIRGVGD